MKKDFKKDLSSRDQHFRPDELLLSQMKIDDEESKKIILKIKEGIEEGINNIKKETYDNAYKSGYEDGEKKAYSEKLNEIETTLDSFKIIVDDLLVFREKVAKANEDNLVKLTYLIAETIVNDRIEKDPLLVKSIIEKVVKFASQEEKINIKISKRDFEFVEKIKEHIFSKYNNLNNLNIEPDKNITNGGCVIETNFAKIDANIRTIYTKISNFLKIKKEDVVLETEAVTEEPDTDEA